ncbi:hypothetical protein HK407_05g10330 [Ordospora pajunii]|jgi:hypothetical protein|uniref:uncharacterized protein n=1 Tax=Ordospora pajunii TaxID=3039483 RepID=UPI0029528064|nr:uncharacterized protein HK407_05g10330 [Ordospora pajunii]KAH9411366.1 hypothetical protein HK407_05g10330 [Ordospora pajunii]
MARKHKIAAIALLLIVLVVWTCIAILISLRSGSKEMHAEANSCVHKANLDSCKYDDLIQNAKIDDANAKLFSLYGNSEEKCSMETKENPKCIMDHQDVPEEDSGCELEIQASEMAWEDRLVSRKDRLISFNTRKGVCLGEFLFVKLRSVINQILDAKPSEERCKMYGISYEQGALVCHYLKHLRLFVQKPMIAYDDSLNSIGIYDIYTTAIDCFTGHKLTRYHSKSKLNSAENAYSAYLRSFVDERFDRILGTYKSNPNTVITLSNHIIYVLLDYIHNFYTDAKKTLNLLQAKIDIEKRCTKGEAPGGFEQSRNYLYEDILETVRPIHFVNNNAEIVKPSLLS